MKQKQSSDSTITPPLEYSPFLNNQSEFKNNEHNRQTKHSQKNLREILSKFSGAEDEPTEFEDIIDDSDSEERSIKQLNMFQVMGAGAAGLQIQASVKGVISKIYSEHDFLARDQAKDNGIKLSKDFNQIHFKFDEILLPKDSQEAVFSKLTGLIDSFLQGINGTIFAYGQTGAGKTYTITGSYVDEETSLIKSQRKGILPRTLDLIDARLSSSNQPYRLYLSFYEIYNEKIYDLMAHNQQPASIQKRSKSPQPPIRKALDIREDPVGHFSIPDLRQVEINSLVQAYEQLELGLSKRATSSTYLNAQSSRSHSIMELRLETPTFKSKLRVVDLAGSEKYTLKRDLSPMDKQLKVSELTSINSSLSALGQCISALSDPSRKHIPFRNSKLTKVLKDSLDSSSVALIICISPSLDSYKETLSTLQFADRAKKAIMDGRTLSDSKLLPQGGGELRRQLEEEKERRRELEWMVREKNKGQEEVKEQMERLRRENKELQDKLEKLEKGQKLRSCMKENDGVEYPSGTVNIEIKEKKRVRFAAKLDNDRSLDSDTRERIEHNLKYNDDTIFDNISIFRDIGNSETQHHKIRDKEKHPSLLGKAIIPDSEEEEENVSPILKRKPNNSSQELSKDLIELEKDQVLNQLVEEKRGIGDLTIHRRIIKPEPVIDFIIDSYNANEQPVEPDESAVAKDYHICDTSEQFYDFDDPNKQDDPEPGFGEDLLTDNLLMIPNEEIQNNNTLILDSQSMIMDQDQRVDPNLSQQMQALEASQILQQPSIQPQNQFFFSLGGHHSAANSSQVNTDVLTYSLTNTFTTIESLHDELAALRTGLELSQKRGASIIKTIHQYAREIEENKLPEFTYNSQQQQQQIILIEEESKHEEENINDDQSLISAQEDNLAFIRDIKGFYSKIHNEIAQLKSILMEGAKNSQSPLLSRKLMISERVPQKGKNLQQQQDEEIELKRDESQINIEFIDKSQEIIHELRREMEAIIGNKSLIDTQEIQNKQKYFQSSNKSLKVLDLLEMLQFSLVQAVTPLNKDSQIEGLAQENDQHTNLASLNHSPSNPLSTFKAPQDPKSLIHYEEMASSQPSPLKSDKNNRTPEIFKSLAKLDESSTSGPFEQFSSSQQTNAYQINTNVYFSQQSQQQQDMQITLRSYNMANQEAQTNEQPQTQIVKKRSSMVDHTLTLIFDSDDEQQVNECKDDTGENSNSPIFNDVEDSKIERLSSNVNRTNNQIVTSNSFQADNSLIFFANNIIIGGIETAQQLQESISNKQKQRNQSFSSKLDRSSNKGVIPDNNLKSSFGQKRTNRKYLMPSKSKESPDQIQLIKPKSQHELLHSQEASLSIEINKSTSKNSVQKYWNQFFNNNNKSMKTQPTDNLLLQNFTPSQPTRNQHQYISRSAYQSNSFKDEI